MLYLLIGGALASIADIDADGGVALLQLKTGERSVEAQRSGEADSDIGEADSDSADSAESTETTSLAQEIVRDLGSWIGFGTGDSKSEPSQGVLAQEVPAASVSFGEMQAQKTSDGEVDTLDPEAADELDEEEEDGEDEEGTTVFTPVEVAELKQLDDQPETQAIAALKVMQEKTSAEVDAAEIEAKFAERKALEAEMRATQELMKPDPIVDVDLSAMDMAPPQMDMALNQKLDDPSAALVDLLPASDELDPDDQAAVAAMAELYPSETLDNQAAATVDLYPSEKLDNQPAAFVDLYPAPEKLDEQVDPSAALVDLVPTSSDKLDDQVSGKTTEAVSLTTTA